MLIVVLDYSYGMLTFCCMIFYLILHMYIFIVTYFVNVDIADCLTSYTMLIFHGSMLSIFIFAFTVSFIFTC